MNHWFSVTFQVAMAAYLAVGLGFMVGLMRWLLKRPRYPRPPTFWVWIWCVLAWPLVAAIMANAYFRKEQR